MKVICINGSPHPHGNTFRALEIASQPLLERDIQVEHTHIGTEVFSCRGCYQCMKRRNGTCAIENDQVNQIYAAVSDADGLFFGSPVYYGGLAGGMKCFLDRLFYIDNSNGHRLAGKAAAPVVVARRAGGLSAVNGLINYFTLSGMLTIGSLGSWPVAYGRLPGEITGDEEGIKLLTSLGKNMATHLMRDA